MQYNFDKRQVALLREALESSARESVEELADCEVFTGDFYDVMTDLQNQIDLYELLCKQEN